MKHIFFVTLVYVLLSCSNNKEKPKEILSEDEMVEVIAEIEITQALIKLKFSKPDTLVNQQELYNQVYDEFNTSEEQFNKSLIYYCKKPIVLQEIYIRVINNISQKQTIHQK